MSTIEMQKLATILADMLRSALTWEQVHERPSPNGDGSALGGILSSVYPDAEKCRGGKHDDAHKDG
ncbi:MAG TPA: hypothetical protein VIH69_06740 [Dehalococcoidia bacterium]